MPVNVVFVGYDEGDAPWAAVRSQLTGTSAPLVRSRAFYGITERLGLDYSYDYRPHYTSRAWEDGFFTYHAAGYALIANRIAADILRDRNRGRAAGDLQAADRELVAAQSAQRGRDYGGMLAHSAAAYRKVRAGAARAGVRVVIRQPSTWTVPPRGRNHGSRMKPSTIDLPSREHRKRMQP